MGLLQRYILGQLIKVFSANLAVLTILLVFVGLFRDATENGLGIAQAIQILPFIVLSLLPFTIPATLLLTVCVVYGRIAADQETTATKAAGINILSLMWPSILFGCGLSVCSLALTDQMIPWSIGRIQRALTLAMEDIFLELLRTDNQMVDRRRGITIAVARVDGRRLIMPTFRYAPNDRDPTTVQAEEATLKFDVDGQRMIVYLKRGHVLSPDGQRAWFEEIKKPFPLPNEIREQKPRHLSMRSIRKELRHLAKVRQAAIDRRDIDVALSLALGHFRRLSKGEFKRYESQIKSDRKRANRLQTELHSRFAMSCSCFCFVLLGTPFAILQARRQFLTSFFLCFMPILLVYYPLVLLMMNLSRTGTVDPSWAMWSGNVVILAAAFFAFRPVLRH